MGPKKDQLRIKTVKCAYDDRGHCKFGDEYNNKHFDKVCNDRNCTEEICNKMQSADTIRKTCVHSHVTFASDDVRNDALEKKLEVLENQVMEIKKKDGMCKEASKKVEAFENIIEQKEYRNLNISKIN